MTSITMSVRLRATKISFLSQIFIIKLHALHHLRAGKKTIKRRKTSVVQGPSRLNRETMEAEAAARGGTEEEHCVTPARAAAKGTTINTVNPVY